MHHTVIRTSFRRMAVAGAASAVAAVSVAVLALGALAAPAHAVVRPATGPSLSPIFCDALGKGLYECDSQISGGTAPYTQSWTGSGMTFTNTSLIGEMDGRCAPGSPVTLTLTVTDSTGAQGSNTTHFTCTALAN